MPTERATLGKTKILSRLFLILTITHVVLYAIYHLSYVFIMNEWSIIFSYLYLYLGKAVSILLPAFIATVAIMTYAYLGRGKMLLYAFLLSLSTLFHSIPYYYIICISYGFDTFESLLLLLPISLGAALLCFGLSVISALIGLLALKEKNKSIAKAEALRDGLATASVFDGASRVGRALLIPSIVAFAVQFIREVVDALSFFIDSDWSYELTDLTLIILNLVFTLLVLVLSALSTNLTKKKILKNFT